MQRVHRRREKKNNRTIERLSRSQRSWTDVSWRLGRGFHTHRKNANSLGLELPGFYTS